MPDPQPDLPDLPDLPGGLTARPLSLADTHAVYEVIAEQERHDVGEPLIVEADITGDWVRPSFEVSTSTVGVLDGDRLVAYAEHSGGDRGDAAVLPAYRGRGLGTALARWMQERARSRGAAVVGMPVPRGSAGDRLLEALGYRVRWESWHLALPGGAEIPARALPAGFALREAEPADHEACWTVLEDAFLEWSAREREPYADFLARTVGRPGFAPWQLRVVLDPEGVVVGAATVFPNETDGYVDRIAVRRDHRGRGLAQALLADAFAVARAHGCTTSSLDTDSRTGALGLYERVGMRVQQTWVNRAIDLVPPAGVRRPS